MRGCDIDISTDHLLSAWREGCESMGVSFSLMS